MTQPIVERRRTGVDLVVGILLILGALFLLGNVVLATALSVRVLGWTALVGGAVLLVRALVGARAGTSWPSALGGVVLARTGGQRNHGCDHDHTGGHHVRNPSHRRGG